VTPAPTPPPELPQIPVIPIAPPAPEKLPLPPNTFPSETYPLENGKISISGKELIVHVYKSKGKDVTIDRKAILFPANSGTSGNMAKSLPLDEKKLSYLVKSKGNTLNITAKGYSWKENGGKEKAWKMVLDIYLPANEKSLKIEAPYIYVHELSDIVEVELESKELLDIALLQNTTELRIISSAHTVNLKSLTNVNKVEVEATRSVSLGDINAVNKLEVTTEKGNITASSLSGIKEATFDNELDVSIIDASKIDDLNCVSKRSSISIENLSESRNIELNARQNIDIKDAHLIGRLIAYSVDSEITMESATLIEELELSSKGDLHVNYISDVPNREFMSKVGVQLIRTRKFQ
jgi:hypothetical protein